MGVLKVVWLAQSALSSFLKQLVWFGIHNLCQYGLDLTIEDFNLPTHLWMVMC